MKRDIHWDIGRCVAFICFTSGMKVAKYSHILRIDEDIEISKFNPYVFEEMEEMEKIYLTGRFTKDIHRLTNNTLPKFFG